MTASTTLQRPLRFGISGLLAVSLAGGPLPAGATTAPSVTIGTVHGIFYANPFNTGGFDPAHLPASTGAQPPDASGSLQLAPAAGFATNFPVVGAYNALSGPALRPVTVNFPSAGVYPIELDYSECCDGELVLLLGTDQAPGPIPA